AGARMPTGAGALAPEGAVVPARIGWSSTSAQTVRAALRPVPPPGLRVVSAQTDVIGNFRCAFHCDRFIALAKKRFVVIPFRIEEKKVHDEARHGISLQSRAFSKALSYVGPQNGQRS